MNPNHGAMREIYSQYTKILQEQKNPQEGILVMIEDDSNATKWTVLFANFPADTALAKDVERFKQEKGIDHIKLELQFPETYPTDPPFIRVISPRFRFHTGHVTIGGSLCIETLVNTGTSTGWQPSMSIWSVLVQCKQLMVDGDARLDFHGGSEYTLQEAKAAFTRVAGQHGWIARKVKVDTNPGVASAGLYVPHYPLECNPWWDKYQLQTLEVVELPGNDPKDNGVGSMRHKEAVAIAKIFTERWTNTTMRPTIKGICRVQNMRVFDRFYVKLCELAYFKKDGVNEKWMFHGLKTTEAAKAILEHGFDTRVAQRGFLGAGIYCADNSDLAHSYTHPCDSTNVRHCIYGRFLLGITENVSRGVFTMETYRRGEKFAMYHEGEKRTITRNYDSESSFMVHNNQPFSVLYSNEQAYPDYIISYTV